VANDGNIKNCCKAGYCDKVGSEDVNAVEDLYDAWNMMMLRQEMFHFGTISS
jgi:hypothetical protein